MKKAKRRFTYVFMPYKCGHICAYKISPVLWWRVEKSSSDVCHRCKDQNCEVPHICDVK